MEEDKDKRQDAKEYQTKEEDGKKLFLDEVTNEWVSKSKIKALEKQRANKSKTEENKKV